MLFVILRSCVGLRLGLNGRMMFVLYVFFVMWEMIVLGWRVREIVFCIIVFLGFGGLMMWVIFFENWVWMCCIRYGDFVNLFIINIILMFGVSVSCVVISFRILFIMGLKIDFKFWCVSFIIDEFLIVFFCFVLYVFYFVVSLLWRMIFFVLVFDMILWLNVYLIFF